MDCTFSHAAVSRSLGPELAEASSSSVSSRSSSMSGGAPATAGGSGRLAHGSGLTTRGCSTLSQALWSQQGGHTDGPTDGSTANSTSSSGIKEHGGWALNPFKIFEAQSGVAQQQAPQDAMVRSHAAAAARHSRAAEPFDALGGPCPAALAVMIAS